MDIDLGELETKTRSWAKIVSWIVLFLSGLGAGWFLHA